MARTIAACPVCGGTSGFYFAVRVRMFGFWGEPAESSDIYSGVARKVRCADGGALVSRALAERSLP